MRHQRQRARFIAHIAQDQIDQAWLKVIATALGRFFDRAAQLIDRHRADIDLLLGDRIAQFRILRQMGIEVGANREDEGDETLTPSPAP